MITPDPDRQALAERDRATVLNCEHGAIELETATVKYPHGPADISILTCVTCPTLITLTITKDPRDDVYARYPLGN